MDYKESLSYLDGLSRFGSRPGLTTIQYLLYLIGNPERRLKIIHIAGTNGKGSTSSMLSRGLKEVGYRVGTYTSPHLFSIRERIKIDGEDVEEKEFAHLITFLHPYIERVANKEGCFHPTFFETLTAAAFYYFAQKDVDIVVLETGMGGRFDATNVAYPLISVITHVARDHTNFLGYKLEKIAEEKCGIIKGGIPVVSARQEGSVKKVIEENALYKGSPAYFAEGKADILKVNIDGTTFIYKDLYGGKHNVEISLIGPHQMDNAALSLYTAEILKYHWDYDITLDIFIRGIKKVWWPGRFQVLRRNPYIILDGAHNVDGVKRLVETLKLVFPDKKVVLLMGVLRDKEYRKMASLLSPFVKKVILTTPESDRALSPYILKEEFEKFTDIDVDVIPSPIDAIKYTEKLLGRDEILLITGSLYLIGLIGRYIMRYEKT